MSDIVFEPSPADRDRGGVATPADRRAHGRARVLNLVGLVSPIANLGMTRTAPADLRWFGVGAGVLLCGAAVMAWRSGHVATAASLAALHLALVLAGLVNPRLPEIAGRAWIAFGRGVGHLMSYPIFAALYFLVLTPTAVLVRLFSGDPLKRSAPRADSYWTERAAMPRERFERQF
jgi:hypothetical protein